ncbi:MAG: choice-of-anchor R domain-containing protein [Pseudomonadota bacterium]
MTTRFHCHADRVRTTAPSPLPHVMACFVASILLAFVPAKARAISVLETAPILNPVLPIFETSEGQLDAFNWWAWTFNTGSTGYQVNSITGLFDSRSSSPLALLDIRIRPQVNNGPGAAIGEVVPLQSSPSLGLGFNFLVTKERTSNFVSPVTLLPNSTYYLSFESRFLGPNAFNSWDYTFGLNVTYPSPLELLESASSPGSYRYFESSDQGASWQGQLTSRAPLFRLEGSVLGNQGGGGPVFDPGQVGGVSEIPIPAVMPVFGMVLGAFGFVLRGRRSASA